MKLIFHDLQTENGPECLNDYVEFTSFGAKPQRVCGRRLPKTPMIGFGPANVTFVSNDKINMRGFKIVYHSNTTSYLR